MPFRVKYSALGTSLVEVSFACLTFDRFSLWYNHRQLDGNLPTFEKRRLYSHSHVCIEAKTSAPLICLKWFGISRLHLLTGVPHMLLLFKHHMSSIWSYASDWKHSQFTSILCVTIIEVPLDWFHADPLWTCMACVSSEEINNINLSHCSNVILSPIRALSLSRNGGEIFHKANVNAQWHCSFVIISRDPYSCHANTPTDAQTNTPSDCRARLRRSREYVTILLTCLWATCKGREKG